MTTTPAPSSPNEGGSLYIAPKLDDIEQMLLPLGSTIGRYRIIEEIDRGGMATVYKAVQIDLDRFVALKIMPSNITLNTGFMERFMREAHAVAQLNHPNIVAIYDVARENNVFFIAMEYISGPNLYHYLFKNKPKLKEVLEIVDAIIEALSFAHERKIIHRDLKLNNIIMKNGVTPVLIDFGLAKMVGNEGQSGLTRTGELIGSPAYMAPERLMSGTVDFRSDICSVGIMLYEMLTFKNPYLDQRNLHQTAMNVMEANPIPPRKLVRWLPSEIEAITLKAMARDPADRYQTMDEFLADIRRYQSGRPVEARPPTLRSRVQKYVKRHWAVLSVAATVALFSLLFSGSLYLQNRKELSHWQLVQQLKFSDRVEEAEWHFFPYSDSGPRGGVREWRIDKGVLAGGSRQFSFARYEPLLNHDTRVEFEVGAAEKTDLCNAGFFLFGETPDSAWCFHLNRNGTGESGIAMPGGDFLFRVADRTKIRFLPVNHITVECIQNGVTFTINGVVAARIRDNLPPLGRTHQQFGFFIEQGNAWFDNVKIYRRAIPATPSPAFVAERFLERGDFEAALEEYRTLLVDFKKTTLAPEIRLGIAECLIRTGRSNEATAVLAESDSVPRAEAIESQKVYLKGFAQRNLGHKTAADSNFRLLASEFAGSGANLSAMTRSAAAFSSAIRSAKLDMAEKLLVRFDSLYPRYSDISDRLASLLLEKYLDAQMPDSAIAVMERHLSVKNLPADMAAEANAALGRAFLAKGLKDRATDVFNRCITAQAATEGVWNSWLGLAEIYEYDLRYPEARKIYLKIFQECPKTLMLPWIAALKLGELASPDSIKQRTDYFTQTATGTHCFPIPRLIARYYLDEIDEAGFIAEWNLLLPQDYTYLFRLARKAMFSQDGITAEANLQQLKECAAPLSWNYIVVSKALNNIRRW